ncbi:MAG: aminotransferase class I/II-fold pyridoxal phosphate-dependent enzyme [Bacteroidales bacterium]|nr:aminotransferase class I/II-fold pyridoxal phosphate-dependent enzyme [Bacteroidales bacterium]MBQ9639908.1 aminotransferase class I/II-fold pyridoxal phosphate-dependent enzyme [Bacteroidales bacterium]
MKPLQQKLARYTEPQKVKRQGVYPYFRVISSDQDAVVTMDGKRVLMLGSNSYLGLTNHPKIKEAAIEATRKYGTGCAGSPFLNGTLDIHIELEQLMAEFLHKDGVMLFSAGFQANSGTIPAITGRGDYVIYDEMDHASIIEGRRLTFAETLKYKHGSMEDLERVLQRCPLDAAKLVVTDGVFSMEGDVAKLPQIHELCDKYNATLMVDEAHSLGVFGREGRGVCDHFGLLESTEVVMGTFSKSLAAIGGFVASDAETINWMKHNVRPYIFTASIAPAAAASVIAAMKIMRSEPERQENLWRVTNYALKCFREAGFEIGHTETPIIPLYVRDDPKTFQVTRMLLDEGVFVNPVVSPAVPPKDTLIRLSWMATHTIEQVDYAVDKVVKCFKKLDLLK